MRYEIHLLRSEDASEFDATTLVATAQHAVDARRIASEEAAGLEHGTAVVDTVEGWIDYGDRIVYRHSHADAVARLEDLDLPVELADQDGGSDAEHWTWLCTASDDEISGWAAAYLLDIEEGGDA